MVTYGPGQIPPVTEFSSLCAKALRMKFASSPSFLPAMALALLAGCGGTSGEERRPSADPVIESALNEEIMVDPDLARQNPRGAALSPGGPASAPIPPLDASAETIAAARAEAARLLGGSVRRAPDPVVGGISGAALTAELTANGALAQGSAGRGCVSGLDHAFGWAAKMPPAFPVYPRGHVQEAAGTDHAGCRLRVVNFLTPVPVADLVDFYWTRASTAGFAPRHRLQGDDHVIAGGRGEAAFVAYVRTRDTLTEVDLVTNGS